MRLLALFLALFLAAPAWAKTQPDTELQVAKRVKKRKVARLLVGRWQVELSADQRRKIETMRIAMDPESTDADIDALGLTEAERSQVDMGRALAKLKPEEAEKARQQRIQALEALTRLVLQITDVGMTTLLPGGETVTATYTVQRAADNTLVLSVTAEDTTDEVLVHFVDADHIRLGADSPDPLPLTRVE